MAKRKRILYVVSTLRVSGPINVLYNIVKYLDREHFEAAILTLSPEPDESALPRFKNLRIQVYSLGFSRMKGFISGPSALRGFVAKYCPDILHTHGFRADMIAARSLKGIKHVTTIHNYPYYDYPIRYGRLAGTCMSWLHINILRQIKIVVACSNALAKMLKQHLLSPCVIRNGVSQEVYHKATKEERFELRRKLKLPQDKKIFVSVGHLSTLKDPKTVLRGFLGSNVRNDSLLLMIGDGPLRNFCEAIAKQEHCIQFTGRVSNVADYLKAADYFISASLAEGLPNSVMEALACGLPVFLSNIEPHKEILNLNSKAGILFQVGNVEDLTRKLNEHVNNNWVAKSEAAIKIVKNVLNARRMSSEYQHLYENI